MAEVEAPPEVAAAPENPTETPSEPLTGEALLEAIQKQVEYYFSKQNLANDVYLVSQMDAQMFVPLDIIASFKGVQRLTMDSALIMSAVKTSKALLLDETGPFPKMRPNVTSERSTLILREVPSATPQEEVKALFGEHAAEIDTIRSEIGDNWYVNFTGEPAAMVALEHLQKQTFNDQPVRARIKSESFIRSFYAQQSENGAYQQPVYSGYKGKGGKGGAFNPAAVRPQQGASMYYTADIDPNMQRGGKGGRGRGGKGGGYYGMPGQYQQYQQYNNTKGGAPTNAQQVSGKGKKKNKKGQKAEEKVLAAPKPQVVAAPSLSADDFPALPASPGTERKVGYTTPYKSWSAAEIANVVAKLGENGVVPVPDCIPAESPCLSKEAHVNFESDVTRIAW